MRHDDIHNKPLSESVVLILASLAVEPRHGYAILKDVDDLSGGRVSMSTGTLYGALRRLLDEGWIRRFEQADMSRDKQAYILTAVGRRCLNAELDRMKELTRAASLRLRESEAK